MYPYQKNSKIFIALLFIIFFLVSCQKSSKSTTQKSKISNQVETYEAKGVKLLYSYGDDSLNILYDVSSIFIQKDSRIRIFALDRGGFQVKVFDEKLHLLKSIGSKGNGPGEFNSPVLVGGTQEIIVVTEQFSPRGHLFDKNLSYLRDLYLEIIPISVASFSKNDLWLSGPSLKKMGDVDIGKYSIKPPGFKRLKIDYLKQIPEFLQSRQNISPTILQMWKFCRIAANEKKLWIASMFQNKIMCLKSDMVLWEKSLGSLPEHSDISQDNKLLIPANNIIQDISVDENDFCYVLAGDCGEEPNRLIFILDQKGNEIGQLVLPFKTSIIKCFSSGKIVTVDKNRIRMHCFDITSNPIKMDKHI